MTEEALITKDGSYWIWSVVRTANGGIWSIGGRSKYKIMARYKAFKELGTKHALR